MNAWGVVLLWSAVQVGVFLLAGTAVYGVVRRQSPATGAWTLAAVLIAAIGLSAIAIRPWPRWWSVDAVWQQAAKMANALRQPDELPVRSASRVAAEPKADLVDRLPADLPMPHVETEADIWNRRWSDFEDELLRAETAGRWNWPARLAAIVLGCVALGFARLGVALVLAQRFGARAAPIDSPELQSLLNELRVQLGDMRRMEARESNRRGSPCTLGWFRPIVVLPADWRTWTPDELRSVLAHELAHVARGDFAIGLLAQVGAVLHCYNPLAWWLLGRLRLEQEMAADLAGAKLAGGRQVYLATIARMALRENDLPLMARPFLPARGTLLRRVETLHKQEGLREGSISWTSRVAVAALLLLTGGLLAGGRGPNEQTAEAAPADAVTSEPVITDESALLVSANKEYQSAYNRIGYLRRDLRNALKARHQNKTSLTPETERAVSEARQTILQAELALAEMESDLRLNGEDDASKRHATARQAYLQKASAEKLKVLWVALNNYVDVHRHFPPAVEIGPDNKTPHSWRVALLRFLDDDLFERYRLDEPWDSEHNRQIIAAGADLFSVPAETPSEDCGYFAIVGAGLMFDPVRATSYRDVKDGSPQTIAIVEADRSIPWTKPEDLALSNDDTPPTLGGVFPGGFHTLFLNGNIHFLSDDVDPEVLQALATLSGGEELMIDRKANRLQVKPAAADAETGDAGPKSTKAPDMEEILAIVKSSDPRLELEQLNSQYKKLDEFIRKNPDRVTPEIKQAHLYLAQRLRSAGSDIARHPEMLLSRARTDKSEPQTEASSEVEANAPKVDEKVRHTSVEVERLRAKLAELEVSRQLVLKRGDDSFIARIDKDIAETRTDLRKAELKLVETSGASPSESVEVRHARANRKVQEASLKYLEEIRRQHKRPVLPDDEQVSAEEYARARRDLRAAELKLVDAESDAHPLPAWKDLSVDERHAVARKAYLRQSSFDQLKRIGLGFHNFHDQHKRFPAAAEMGPDGKTTHSWRVALLPYLNANGEDLYKRYRLDEPWDSEHNKQLIAEGAHFYNVPTESPSEDCGYFVFTGPGTVFDPAAPASTLRSITDGTAFTIGVAEAIRSVPWSKPEDLPFSPSEPLPKLGGNFEGGFTSMFMDGSAHFIPADVDESALRALVTKAGGEHLEFDKDGIHLAR
jgi:beta-lactamase regulating signal transducer with metallopeptidase domain